MRKILETGSSPTRGVFRVGKPGVRVGVEFLEQWGQFRPRCMCRAFIRMSDSTVQSPHPTALLSTRRPTRNMLKLIPSRRNCQLIHHSIHTHWMPILCSILCQVLRRRTDGQSLCLYAVPGQGGEGTKIKFPLAPGNLNLSPRFKTPTHPFFPTCNLIPARYKLGPMGAREIKVKKYSSWM